MLKQTMAVLATVALGAGSAAAQDFDQIVLKGSGATRSGNVTAVGKNTVTLNQGARGDEQIQVNTIKHIYYVDESREVKNAKLAASNGRYADALRMFDEVDESAIERQEIKDDVQFYKALCEARMAQGAGAQEIEKAKEAMLGFARARGAASFHFYEAAEVLGDLEVAAGNYAGAERYYSALAQAPWLDYKMKAGVLVGRARQAQGKHSEAITQFDQVIAQADNSDAAKRESLSATLGKALSLAETNQIDQALELVNGVIEIADPENMDLHARAYNVLGACHKKAGNTKAALLAYLHVDLLYFARPDAHAEALAQLSELWQAVGKGDRARQAAQLLRDRYPDSRWAQN